MPLIVKGQLKVHVKATDEIVTIDDDDLIQDVTGRDERSMGDSIEYSVYTEVAGHEVAWTVWEYPIGMEELVTGPKYNSGALEILDQPSVGVSTWPNRDEEE